MNKKMLIIKLPLIALVAATASPVLAQSDSGYDEQAGINRAAERMADPIVQDRVADTVEGMTAAIMDLPVGEFAAAMDRAVPGSVDRNRIHRDDRLGDLAGPDRRHLPQDVAARTRSMMGAASGMAEMLAVMMPEFKRLGREMADRVEASVEDARYRRD